MEAVAPSSMQTVTQLIQNKPVCGRYAKRNNMPSAVRPWPTTAETVSLQTVAKRTIYWDLDAAGCGSRDKKIATWKTSHLDCFLADNSIEAQGRRPSQIKRFVSQLMLAIGRRDRVTSKKWWQASRSTSPPAEPHWFSIERWFFDCYCRKERHDSVGCLVSFRRHSF